MRKLAILVLLLAVATSLEFGLSVDAYETQCFYEQLGTQRLMFQRPKRSMSWRSSLMTGVDMSLQFAPLVTMHRTSSLRRPQEITSKYLMHYHVDSFEQVRTRAKLLLILHSKLAGRATAHFLQAANRVGTHGA